MVLNPFLLCVLRKSRSLLLHPHTDAEQLHALISILPFSLGKSLASLNQFIILHTGNPEMILGNHSRLSSPFQAFSCVMYLSNEFHSLDGHILVILVTFTFVWITDLGS